MAVQRITFPVKHIEPGIMQLSGQFTFDGANPPTENDGKHTSVSRVSAGVYRIQIAGSGTCDIRNITALLQVTGGNDFIVKLNAVDETNRRIDFGLWDISGAALADPTSATSLRWSCEVKNTTAK